MAVEGRAGWEQANMKGKNSFNNGFKIQQIRFKTICIKQNWCTFFTIYEILFSLDICNILSCCTMAFFFFSRISLKCHLRNKSRIWDEHARKLKKKKK